MPHAICCRNPAAASLPAFKQLWYFLVGTITKASAPQKEATTTTPTIINRIFLSHKNYEREKERRLLKSTVQEHRLGKKMGIGMKAIAGGATMFTQSRGFRRHLGILGVDAMKPHPRDDGTKRWLRPKISRRQWKVARKQAILGGTYGNFDAEKGGWQPEWDEIVIKEPQILWPHKLHKRQRTRADRAKKIDDAMAAMPKKIEEYRKSVIARKPTPGFETTVKRLLRKQKG